MHKDLFLENTYIQYKDVSSYITYSPFHITYTSNLYTVSVSENKLSSLIGLLIMEDSSYPKLSRCHITSGIMQF